MGTRGTPDPLLTLWKSDTQTYLPKAVHAAIGLVGSFLYAVEGDSYFPAELRIIQKMLCFHFQGA